MRRPDAVSPPRDRESGAAYGTPDRCLGVRPSPPLPSTPEILTMEALRFDTLTRAVDARSRRRIVGSVSSMVVGALGFVLVGPQTGAKKKGNKKHNGKKDKARASCPDCAVCPGPPATPTCAGVCGSCKSCFTRAADSLLCSSSQVGDYSPDCAAPCSSDNECVDTVRPYCVTHYQVRDPGSGNFTDNIRFCEDPGGHCTGIRSPCSA
jgi:hypothetical protein